MLLANVPLRHTCKSIAVLSFALALCCVGVCATPPEISTIQFKNVTQTTVDVTWTTVHPSTSQVLLARDTNYEAERWIPSVADPTLTTSHRVTVDRLVPYNAATGDGQNYIKVASVDASGTLSVSPSPWLSMRTAPTNLTGTPNTLVYTTGPHTAYAGYDTYFSIQPILVSGPASNLYIQNAGGYNNNTDGVISPAPSTAIGVHYSCQWANPTGADSAEQSYNSTTKLGYCAGGNSQNYHSVRLRVPAGTAPGSYSVTVTLISNGQTISTTYPFTVVTPVVGTVIPKSPIPIPGLSTWETQMDTLGRKWCTYRDTQDAKGGFEAWGIQTDAWFYDGGRVFQQIEDYTANVLNQPNHAYWQHCAQAILNPYAYYLNANKGSMAGYSIFPYGMTMNYWRTHDVVMLDAVNIMATVGTQYRSTGSVDPYGMRENAYRANMWMANSQLGAAQWPLLQRNIDKLIGNLIMGAEGTGAVGAAVHPFMVGLAVETLSRWYAFSVAAGKPDYRVVPVVKAALDTLWNTNWLPSGWFNYNRYTLPVGTSDNSLLNNLNSQGYAWLWYMTGDPVEQQRANLLFSNAFHPAAGFDYDGKEFSQEFEFSFDTVRLLQNNGLSYTDPASNIYWGYWPVTTPPTIQSPKIGSDHATITWTTYVPATSQVVYGTTTAYGMQTAVSDTSGTLSHSLTLTGLLPAKTYHYRAKSVDMVGNASQTTDLTFTTP